MIKRSLRILGSKQRDHGNLSGRRSRNTRLSLEHLETRAVPAIGITAFNVAAGTVEFTAGLPGSDTNTLALAKTAEGLLAHTATVGIYASETDIDPGPGVASLTLTPTSHIDLRGNASNFGVIAPSSISNLFRYPDLAASATTNFVTSLYHYVLGRQPDAAGLAFWKAEITNGTSREDVVADFWNSAEHRGGQVDAYYRAYLRRNSDPVGRQLHIDSFLGGMTEDQLAAKFVSSAEYRARFSTNTTYVEGLYRDLLGRLADTAGRNMWLGELPSLGNEGLAATFLSSLERSGKVIDALYVFYLNRRPDAPSRTTFSNQLHNGQLTSGDFAQMLRSSDEFFNRQIL